MDDKDQDQGATDTGIGTAGSTLGGAAAGAVAGTALGVPGRRDRDWCALWGSNWRSKKADENTNKEGEVGGCTSKKEELNDKAINQDENEADHRPQSYQEDAGQKAEAESPSNLDCTPERN